MSSNQRGTAWPYLFVLFGLFALSVTAPRAWNREPHQTPSMEALLLEREALQQTIAAAPAVVDSTPHQAPIEPAVVAAPPVESAWVVTDAMVEPVLVTPLREFSRRVVDPIVEFARRPTELRALPDLHFPGFEPAAPAVQTRFWAVPASLQQNLDQLSHIPQAAAWSTRAAELLTQLQTTPGATQPARQILDQLRGMVRQSAVPTFTQPEPQVEFERVRYALTRRLAVWDGILAMDQLVVEPPTEAPNREIARSLDDLEKLTASINAGDAWREYLLVDQLRQLNQSAHLPHDDRRDLAQQVLNRLRPQRLSPVQRQFVNTQPFSALTEQLHTWAAEPVDIPQLLAALERYEQTERVSDGREVAAACRSLQWMPDKTIQELGDRIGLYYRNANVRVAVSPEFLNRFVPQPSATVAPVYDTIQGVPVVGQSTTFTSVSVRAIPDPQRIRLGLEADGIVSSNTTSDAGPATFHNAAEAAFSARKLLLISPSGMKTWPAVADANSYYSDLRDLQTSFDIVPLVGTLVRNYARTQHADAQPLARREMEDKVAIRARRQFDEEVQPRLQTMADKVETQLLEPLRRMGLDPAVTDMQTTAERLTVRMRLAGDNQLAAHTPRPQAPSDSLVSVQIHQSAINNLLDSLDLAGRQFNVPELYQWIGRKLNRTVAPPEDVPADVILRFAEKDPVRVRCVDGSLELAVSVAELTHGRRRWRDFVVRTMYEPNRSTLEGQLVRTGGIFLEGESLRGRVEFVLRSIFSKAFSIDRPITLLPGNLASDSRLADLEIVQYVIEDGWIGMAYAPQRKPSQTARRLR